MTMQELLDIFWESGIDAKEGGLILFLYNVKHDDIHIPLNVCRQIVQEIEKRSA